MLIAAIINHYGVIVPYGDEWSIVSLFEKWESHQLTFANSYSARRTRISKTHERSRTLGAGLPE